MAERQTYSSQTPVDTLLGLLRKKCLDRGEGFHMFRSEHVYANAVKIGVVGM